MSDDEFQFPPPEKVIAQDVPFEGVPATDSQPVSGPPISFTSTPLTEVTMESPAITVKVKSADPLSEVAAWADKLFSSHLTDLRPRVAAAGFSAP